MPDLNDGETFEMKGSAARPYIIRNVGGVYSCSCPAWRNQSLAIERRTCKHILKLRGATAEEARIGNAPMIDSASVKPIREADGDSSGPGLLLAHSWDNETDLTDWWVSEKLDGVRAYWDGHRIFSRQGNLFYAPDWFIEKLPPIPLDGELWLARKSFQRTVSIVRRQDKSELWRELSYVVFDAPAIQAPFEQRQTELAQLLYNHPPSVRLLEQQRCRSVEHLREELQRVEALGGEGLMLRQPGSLYEAGRSGTLLKVKSFHDAEATVIDHLPGTGKHKGRLGALAVALPDGTQFSIGTGFSDAQRENPPSPGALITFRYQELTDRGVPRFPSFVRVRSDPVPIPGTEMPDSTTHKPSKTSNTKHGNLREASSDSYAVFRRFELIEGKSAKFWSIQVDDVKVKVRYGRIGTEGQLQTKTFSDADAAWRHAEKLLTEKLGKGYRETAVTERTTILSCGEVPEQLSKNPEAFSPKEVPTGTG